MTRTFSIVAATALAAGLGALVWQLTGDRRERAPRRGAEEIGPGANAPAGANQISEQALPAAGRDDARPARAEGPAGDRAEEIAVDPVLAGSGEAGAGRAPAAAGAEADRRYPPSSRSLADAKGRALNPTAGMVDSRAVPSADAAGGETDRPLHFVLEADRDAVVGSEPLTLTLTVYDGPPGSGSRRVRARVIEAVVRDTGPVVALGIPLGSLAFNDDGRSGDAVAGDLVQTCRFVPTEHGLYPDGGFYFAQVAFAVQGYPRTEAKVAFLHTPEDRVPARFTGNFGDRVEDGSLLVSTELEVLRAGQFFVAADLYDARGTALARASNLVALDQGRRMVDLTFYGLILREANVDGPYVVRFVRGHRALSGQFPNREDLPGFAGEHRTAAYGVDEFSDVRWDSR